MGWDVRRKWGQGKLRQCKIYDPNNSMYSRDEIWIMDLLLTPNGHGNYMCAPSVPGAPVEDKSGYNVWLGWKSSHALADTCRMS